MRSLYRRALEAHAGFLTRAEWGQICHCLAPEHAPAELQKQFGEAYRLFIACENLFIKKGERAVAINEKPITRLDLDALKRRTTEERRQKRAKSAKAKPRPR
jgi:hypothetical protein